jgi:hypothetical protein
VVETVSLGNEMGDCFSCIRPSLGVRGVSAHRGLLMRLVVVNSVFGVFTDLICVHQGRVHEAGNYFTVKSQVSLTALLWVTNIQECSFIEWVLVGLTIF